ncbi:helix-turn-helix transcriptional regulator [Halobacillus shinanisalinarum]|uniref:Helix-turn-helix transcriptional regulator n=1 Tax=Halobacillus shinanisalinarum TaxID=2932258 RepID=A0ABY4GZ95_9BACI|nr:helix-turn-helix transcriptional regulator [Halobacillus shinanisalinarum]UOQ93428.1 helix-turn-helix transcriptional regulator [Halobacillus shinanisalinarum]
MRIKVKLNEMIEESGLRKKHIAKKLDVNPTTISGWISGKRRIFLEDAVRLANILNCDVNDLYEIVDERKEG